MKTTDANLNTDHGAGNPNYNSHVKENASEGTYDAFQAKRDGKVCFSNTMANNEQLAPNGAQWSAGQKQFDVKGMISSDRP